MLCQSLLYSKVTQLYSDVYSLKYFFHYDLSQDIQYSSLCYTLGPCCLPQISSFCFHWSVVALPCCVNFCCTTMRISHLCTYIPSIQNLPPTSPFHPCRSSQSTKLSSLCDRAMSHQLSILHMQVYICQSHSLNLFHPPLPCVHKSICYVCISIPPLQNRLISTIFLDSIYMY